MLADITTISKHELHNDEVKKDQVINDKYFELLN